MSGYTVPGLSSALRLCESQKATERAEGRRQVRTLFGERSNLLLYQETASSNGGAGWIALFQCLFETVRTEKKIVEKKPAPLAETRLSDSVSLVRFLAERTVYHISSRPLQVLVVHMTTLMVDTRTRTIYPPTALDYAKALRTLLSYPPHLDNLDVSAWRILLGVCWSALLGDQATIDDDWEEGMDVDDELEDSGGPSSTAAGASNIARSSVTQASNELAILIPLLLSSKAAPLFPPLPTSGTYTYAPSLGLNVLIKCQRFFTKFPTETSSHLHVLRSMNMVLAELELNCRHDFIAGGLELLSSLVGLWAFRNKAIREQVLIALRMIIPFLTHKIGLERDKLEKVRMAMERLVDARSKEVTMRGGFQALDMAMIRLRGDAGVGDEGRRESYEISTFTAAAGIDHDSCLRWAVLELYADLHFHLYQTFEPSIPSTPSKTQGHSAKRRKIGNAITALTSSITHGSSPSRLHALQVMLFLIDIHWADVHLEAQSDVRACLMALLDDSDIAIRSWTYLALAELVLVSSTGKVDTDASTASFAASSRTSTEDADFSLLWGHATRGIIDPHLARPAAYTALILLRSRRIDSTTCAKDLGDLLGNIHIQGPPYPFDSVCAFIAESMAVIRQDGRLFSAGLEEKVIDWLAKWNAVDGTTGRGRLDPQAPSDVLSLLCGVSHLVHPNLSQADTKDNLPDCPIVDRLLHERSTDAIRRYTLSGEISVARRPRQTPTIPDLDPEASQFLSGRPKKVSDIVTGLLHQFSANWPSVQPGSDARPAIPPERCRRTIDIVVLALAYQAVLQLNGLQFDQTCLRAVSTLLDLLLPSLQSTSYDVPSLRLIWAGLDGLTHLQRSASPTSPALLQPTPQSGIRQDLLKLDEHGTEDTMIEDRLLQTIWKLPGVLSALQPLFALALEVFKGSSTQEMPLGTPHAAVRVEEEDDDFGLIRNAETDAIPLSKEAMECQRTTASLLGFVSTFRLRGKILAGQMNIPAKDANLINAFLSKEGQRMIQLGSAIVNAVRHQVLRLNIEAIELILETFEDMILSYAYSRDEGLLALTLDFLVVSAPVWLSTGANGDVEEIRQRVILLAKSLFARASSGQIASWKVRLWLLVFVDEYLDYDPDQAAWFQAGSIQRSQHADVTATDIISAGLVDHDIRVRFRAATSTAGLLYLSSTPEDQHLPFYQDIVNELPREPKHWDSFVTDVLWKLNCCITSPQLRAATIYHLYEIPPATSEYNNHLQIGLETVSRRLGLKDIAPLFLAYAPLIISSQIVAGQSPIQVQHRLYGFPTRQSFALAVLQSAGSSILLATAAQRRRSDFDAQQYARAEEMLDGLCNASGLRKEDVVLQHLGSTSARALSDPHSPLVADPANYNLEEALNFLDTLPLGEETSFQERLASSASDIVTHLFALVDLTSPLKHLQELLDQRDKKKKAGTNIFAVMIPPDSDIMAIAPALVPSAVVEDVFAGLDYIQTKYPLSSRQILLNTLIRLFHQVNSTFLISEQYRDLRAIALVVSMYPTALQEPTVLGLYLREAVPLLLLVDIAPTAFTMLQYGWDQLQSLKAGLTDIVDLVLCLGSVRIKMEEQHRNGPLCEAFDAWIMAQAGSWTEIAHVKPALTIAKSIWPRQMAVALEHISDPSFAALCETAKRLDTSNILAMCPALLNSLSLDPLRRSEQLEMFRSTVFWKIKEHLRPGHQDADNVTAFVEILYEGNGHISPPSIDLGDKAVNDPSLRSLRDDRVLESRSQPQSDPSAAIRVAIVRRMVNSLRDPDYRARSKVLDVLRAVRVYLLDEATLVLLDSSMKTLLELLIPGPPLSVKSSSTIAPLSIEGDDKEWLKRSKDMTSWSVSLACWACGHLGKADGFYGELPALFDQIPSSAQEMLPLLVQATLTTTTPGTLPQNLGRLFTTTLEQGQRSSASVETLSTAISVVLHLRHFKPPYRKDDLGYQDWLEIDAMTLAEAALACGLYKTALMFLEERRSDRQDAERTVDMLDPRVQHILYKVYSSVEDIDGFYGIANLDVWDSLQRRLEHEGDFESLLGIHSATFDSQSKGSPSRAVVKDLHRLGYSQLAQAASTSDRSRKESSNASTYDPILVELAWRTSQWDTPIRDESRSASEGLIYEALRAIHNSRDVGTGLSTASLAITKQLESLGKIGVERIQDVKGAVRDLVTLNDIRYWADLDVQASLESKVFEQGSLTRFTELSSSLPFRDAEKLYAVRKSLFAASRNRESQTMFGDLSSPRIESLARLDIQAQLRFGEIARAEGDKRESIKSLVSVQEIDKRYGLKLDSVQEEVGQVLWAGGEHALAIGQVEGRLQKLRQAERKDGAQLAVLLSRLADWSSRAKLRSPAHVKSTFTEAIRFSQASKLADAELSRLYHDFALFADRQQATLQRSPELERLHNYKERKEAELKSATPSAVSKRSAKSSARTDVTDQLERELREDDAAIESLMSERAAYAKTALIMFAKSFALSNVFDDSVTRSVSLWLESEDNEDINTAFAGPLDTVPPHKFVFLSPQLTARLDRPKVLSAFNNVLNRLILRIATEHPYHILYQVITLADGATISKAKKASDNGAEGRGPAAAAILAQIASDENDQSTLLARFASDQMQRLAKVAIDWSLSRSSTEENALVGKHIATPKSCPLQQLANMSIPVATNPPPIDPLSKYDAIPTIVRYRSTYQVFGGIHRPKVMKVLDSLGVERRELFKGEDELRQDAVMEQVFEMSNKLLVSDRKTKARDLRFRTYTVIPLAKKTGIMEFVGNSMAIGDWLKPAHVKYGKINGDISVEDFRKHLRPLQDKEHTWSKLPAKFRELQARFHPVMRHFFTEKHRDPMTWFTMRLNYTRSVAVTSIVGWMLGIGDRHCSNILIDNKSGELVHIDFGIVFEDGRRLRIPEKVPFRLTNDLVDGFGITGVEGTFRQSSQHVLRVLRESSELIMTVLEVFKHDPLYAWDADPEKLQRAQGGGRVTTATSASALEKADRILSKIKGKLDGGLSVEYTVNELIQEARNEENLAKIFIGWQPWF